MTTFVLVHGAWRGSYTFRHVRKELGYAGHEVFTPSLTGIGERAHLLSPQINLTTHIDDVVNVILYEDLHDIVLLGFSYGGAVITGSLKHVADRVQHLVFVDAFVPRDGETVFGLSRALHDDAPLTVGQDWLVPASFPRTYYEPAEAEFMNARGGPHPLWCFTEHVALEHPLEEYPFTRTYIRATDDTPDAPGAPAFEAAAARARKSAAWNYHEVATNHMLPVNEPDTLAKLLLALL